MAKIDFAKSMVYVANYNLEESYVKFIGAQSMNHGNFLLKQ